MHTLKEYADPRIGDIVSTLHAQVFWLTQCKQQYLDCGQSGASQDFAYAEAVARKAVKDLDALDHALNSRDTPAATPEERQPGGDASSLLGV